jgi:L-threonylcarbamoyladenylate synthase
MAGAADRGEARLAEASHNTVILSATGRGLRAASGLMRRGELVAFPTETVYGLGGDARDDRAIARIFAAKRRPRFNPLIVHVRDPAEAGRLARFPPAAQRLAEAFWPGPLTLVLPRAPGDGLSELVTAGLPTVALRVPAHPVAAGLLAAFGGPVAAPSANPSGRVSPTRAEHVLDGLRGRIAAVIDGGPCPIGLESTIIGFEGETPVLLRPGGLTTERIAAIAGAAPLVADAVTDPHASPRVSAPGQLASHYAPRAGLRLDAASPGPDEAWLGFGPVESLGPSLNLSAKGDLVEAAANLFAHLRALDRMAAEAGLDRIAVAPIPREGLGLAINDRLARAAAPRPPEAR